MLNVEESKEDYLEIEGLPISEDTILPFVIELDAEDSNLYPATNENHYIPVSQEHQDGYVHAYQNASVYIPVEIAPRADSGEIKTSCYGEPTVTIRQDHGSSKYCFTIIQPICVEVPLEFSAEALLGNLHVKCGEETDPDCKPVYEETDTSCEPVCEETDTSSEPVCEETCEVSSFEEEPPKPSAPKNHYYKVFF